MLYGLRGWIGKLLPRGPFFCNLCGYRGALWLWRGHDNLAIRKYQIIGAGRRKCDCFACGSSDRDRLVHEFLKNEISDFSCMKILHVAPERQLNKKLTSLGAKMINIDARKSGYKFAYGSETITADLTCLPFESETFDWVIANHVLEHIIDEKRALSEINRVLKPQGKAILMIPYSPILSSRIEGELNWTKYQRNELLGQQDHVRLYGLDFLESWTETFEIVRLIEVNAPQELNVLIGEKIILVEK